MKQFSLYDVVGVLAPGTVIVVGAGLLYPQVAGTLIHGNLSGGELGLVILLAYIVGNIVAGVSNMLEWPYWAFFGGPHTVRAQKSDGKILSASEYKRLQAKLHETGMLDNSKAIGNLSAKEWWDTTRQIHAFLAGRKLTNRVELFNAQFGMNRGIATAFLIILATTIVRFGTRPWKVELLLAASAAVSLYQMHKFSRHYAQNLFRAFLTAPEKAPNAVAPEVGE
jgi:hypothetical protein